MNKLNKTIKIFFYGLVALAPVFFLPISQNLSSMDNFNKIILLQLALALMFGLFVFQPLQYFRDKFSFSFLDIAFLLWLFLSLLSAFFGNDLYISFWGAYGTLNTPLIVLLCFVLLYFIVKESKNIFETKTLVKIIVLVSSFVLLILSILFSLVGLGAIKPDNFLFDMLRSAVGTTEQLSIYLSFLVVLITGILMNRNSYFNCVWQKVLVLFALFLTIALLVAFNFFPAWICLWVALLVLLIAYLSSEFKNKSFAVSKTFILFILIFVLSGFFLVFHLLNPEYYSLEQRLASRLQLDWNASKNIALNSLSNQSLLGVGAEMFAPVNSLIRGTEENLKPYWYVRFNQGSSFFFEQLIYSGLIGFSMFVIFLLIILYIIIQLMFFVRAEENSDDMPNYLLSALMSVLILATIVYSVNFLILFLFFIFLGILSRRYQDLFFAQTIGVKNLQNIPRALSIVFMIVSVMIFVSFMFNVKHSLALAYYESKEPETIKTAIRLNSHIYQYHLTLSEYYHKQAINALKQANSANNQIAQNYINEAIESARNAARITPYAVAPYENLAKIYRDLGEYSPDTLILSVEFFKKAIEKEPSNPVLFVELGKVYLREGNASEAINALTRAKELKPKYYQADYNLARALVSANQNEEALKILNELSEEHLNIDVLYEQGKAYFNLKNFDQAIKKFSQVISIEPLHANSLYSLGLSYSALGEVDEAMYYLKKVADLNPDNFKLMEQIDDLANIK